ncbi:hypothetical protein [Noviherbaspirillum sp. Root189]|jgi:hypothetical protein|uniref:hypothetical protein n=1 Tax=Noviherbaspirillum sp. Root189 TaxID=1736487 RepID=UPI00070B4FA7|nr:hypothetical protein [Noviherbaspirillum sp. Root189]KRB85219.1 hypothetical protein ASE07_21175 [Noviherbaspirillum sp. Root189]
MSYTAQAVPVDELENLLQRWESSIDVADIAGDDARESVRAFTMQKCIEELRETLGKHQA